MEATAIETKKLNITITQDMDTNNHDLVLEELHLIEGYANPKMDMLKRYHSDSEGNEVYMYGDDTVISLTIKKESVVVDNTVKGNFAGSNTCMFCGEHIDDSEFICGSRKCKQSFGE